MTVSSLAEGCILSPNHYDGRAYPITRLTPHHTAMIGTATQIAAVFKPESRQASCNYAIGYDGSIVCVVQEENASWCTASWDNDNRGITFELSDCNYDWEISDATLESYINLCVDLIQRYPSLGGSYRWTGDMSGNFNVTAHRWFAATACPADFLYSKQEWIMAEVNRRLDGRYGVPMECILHPDECGTLFYVCGTDIVHLDHPDQMGAVDQLADECGVSVPHVEFGTKAAPWGWRFFQACGHEDLYDKYVRGISSPFDEAAEMPQPEPEGTPIMGESEAAAAQMVAAYDGKGKHYPEIYSDKGAPTIEDFCAIVCDEAEAEGVRAEVVFSQAMHETGWLQFGGDVSADQCNFAGIGATGGVAGNSFEDVRQGIRAQVQHLKAYASTDDLANECVDPRFHYVDRGIAPTVEELGGRWAVGSHYGERIIAIMDYVLSMEVDEPEPEPEPERAEKLRYCIGVLTEILEEYE